MRKGVLILDLDLIAMKRNLGVEELSLINMELERKKKNAVVMWLLWLFFGGIGGHRYYLGDYGYAILMTVTVGGIGIWTLIDAFLISKRLEYKNSVLEMQIIDRVKNLKEIKLKG